MRNGRPRFPRVDVLEKLCSGCYTVKPATDFYRIKDSPDGLRGKCKECWNENRRNKQRGNPDVLAKKREDYAKNRETYLAYMRSSPRKLAVFAWKLKHHFGLTVEDFELMMKRQCGVCAICKRSPLEARGHRHKHRLHVDHDHATGQVRGLLCHQCNIALGEFEDSPQRLRAAADYLDFHNPRQEKE